MSVLLVDAKYFGHYFKCARKKLGIKRTDCAKIFGITNRQVLNIENGKLLIPERIIEKIITNGFAIILCKRRK